MRIWYANFYSMLQHCLFNTKPLLLVFPLLALWKNFHKRTVQYVVCNDKHAISFTVCRMEADQTHA